MSEVALYCWGTRHSSKPVETHPRLETCGVTAEAHRVYREEGGSPLHRPLHLEAGPFIPRRAYRGTSLFQNRPSP